MLHLHPPPLPVGAFGVDRPFGLRAPARGPRTWSVQVFGQCPHGGRPGTLFIGTSQFVDLCPSYGADTTQVDMYRSDGRPIPTGRSQGSTHVVRVHGLSVTSSRTDAGVLWTVPSMHVTITGSGPKALSIMQSLSRATPRASPAVGKVIGSEYLEALSDAGHRPGDGAATIGAGVRCGSRRWSVLVHCPARNVSADWARWEHIVCSRLCDRVVRRAKRSGADPVPGGLTGTPTATGRTTVRSESGDQEMTAPDRSRGALPGGVDGRLPVVTRGSPDDCYQGFICRTCC